MARRIDLVDLVTKPGTNSCLVGKRGGGKSALAVTIAYKFLHDPKKGKDRFVITNIPFIRQTYSKKYDREEERKGCPPHMFTCSSTEAMFRVISKLMLDYKDRLGDLEIFVVFDEGQSVFAGQEAGKKGNVALSVKLLAVWRKFRCSALVISPTLTALSPKLRTSEDQGGLRSVLLQKSGTARAPDGGDIRDWVFVTLDDGKKPFPLKMPICPWCRKPHHGGFYYDHLSVSYFSTEEKDDPNAFHVEVMLNKVAGELSQDVPDLLAKYIASIGSSPTPDEGKEEPGQAEPPSKRSLFDADMDWIERMRSVKPPITWGVIAKLCECQDQTLKSRYERYMTSHQDRIPHKLCDIKGKKEVLDNE